jgi:hypothetical protein
MKNCAELLFNGDFVVLKKRSFYHYFNFMIIFVIFISIMYSMVDSIKLNSLISLTSIILIIIFLYIFFVLYKTLRIILGGDLYYFNKRTKKIYNDKKYFCNFNDVRYIEFKAILNDGSYDYIVKIIFVKKNIRIDFKNEYYSATEIANDLSNILKTKIYYNE